jgi:hypothetical protein
MLRIINLFFSRSIVHSFGLIFALSLSMLSPVQAAETAPAGESAHILQEFNTQHRDAEHAKAIPDKEKQRIMFVLGVLLFTLVLITGGLGIAMGIYGKPVFLAHMVFAGLSVTLAIAHAIVGMVWFYPF